MKTNSKTNSSSIFCVKSEINMFLRKFITVVILGILYIPLYAQYDPLPNLYYPLESNYDYKQAKNGQIFNINYANTTPEDKSIWSLGMGQKERYRFCENGTFAFLNSKTGTHRIGFYNEKNRINAYIDAKSLELDIFSMGNIYMSANRSVCLTVNSSGNTSNVPFVVTPTNNVTLKLTTDAAKSVGWIGTTSNNGLFLGTNGNSNFFIDNAQITYIGLTKAEANGVKASLKQKYLLFVKKGIMAEDYTIAPKSSWSDFVFNPNYSLRPLDQVENFISENKHLPDVPSAKQVAEEGYSQHEMNKVLLQKIEEFTLYIIKQDKEITTLKAELDKMKK